MEGLGRLIAFLVLILGIPSLAIWGGWHLAALIPETVRSAIITLLPYGSAFVVWCGLVWVCGNTFQDILD